MNRLPEFRVEHPNLNTPPVHRRIGVRRFKLNKNSNSNDFQLSPEDMALRIEPAEELDHIIRLKMILNQKDQELRQLQKITKNFEYLDANPRKYLSPSPNKIMQGRLLNPDEQPTHDLSSSNIFYSKTKPKISETCPIVGYPTRSFSPNKRIAQYGNLVFNNR